MGVIYTRTLLSADIATMVTTADYATNIQVVANNAVRQVISDADLRSTKRRAYLTPNLFDDIFDYTAPSDLKGNKIIDIQPQIQRGRFDDWRLTTYEEFDRMKTDRRTDKYGDPIDLSNVSWVGDAVVAVSDYDMLKKLHLALPVDDTETSIDGLNSLSDWVLFGDGTNLTTDQDNYVKGSGSINWDISAAGGTTAGIQNTSLDTFDVSTYKTTGSAFVWAYVSSTTNLTNFILRVGSDSSNYYSITITTNNEGLSFQSGWNLLRFDFVNKSTTGTPDDDGCDYAVLYMTKDAAKVSETDYRFDNLILKRGNYYYVIYYSRYGWQSSAGTYLENSTATGDYLNCETDEYTLFLLKTAELTERDAGNMEEAKELEAKYEKKLAEYKTKYPSEALLMSNEYYHQTYG